MKGNKMGNVDLSTLKSVRLNSHIRDVLYVHIKKNLPHEDLLKEIKTAYSKLQEDAIKICKKKYSEKDMKVLKKYDACKVVPSLKFTNLDSKRTFQINMDLKETRSILPKGYSFNNFEDTQNLDERYQAYIKLKNDYDDKVASYFDKYKIFVDSCNTTKQVLQVWPSAYTALKPYIESANKSLPTTLSKETLEFVKETNIG